ncbi:MAG TPA: methyltransferase domain-containing protein [Gammaproteobacteria bacterium]|nr:methyltransferase domain-containing protein [Gammaproteobacteria bacterium]
MSLRAAVEATARPTDDRERDRSSKPAEVLAFVGIGPGMTVLDLAAGGGYFTELLARVVGPRGKVIAHNHPGALAMLGAETFERRYGDERLPNVEQLFARHDDLRLATQSLDAALVSMVYHDVYWSDPSVDWSPIDPHAMLARLRAALKPGGVVGVIDHHAPAGSDPRASAKAAHRVDADVVRRDFLAAGFDLDAESDALRNPDDDRTRSVFDPAVYRRTDRFVLRFRRPDAGARG